MTKKIKNKQETWCKINEIQFQKITEHLFRR